MITLIGILFSTLLMSPLRWQLTKRKAINKRYSRRYQISLGCQIYFIYIQYIRNANGLILSVRQALIQKEKLIL